MISYRRISPEACRKQTDRTGSRQRIVRHFKRHEHGLECRVLKAGERVTVIAVPRKNCMFAQGEQSSRSVELPAKGKPTETRFKFVGASERVGRDPDRSLAIRALASCAAA
jgi:hypothetical protein